MAHGRIVPRLRAKSARAAGRGGLLGSGAPTVAAATTVSDERLRAFCEHVRVWLFGKAKKLKPW